MVWDQIPGFVRWVLTLLGRQRLVDPVLVDLLVEQSGQADLPRILAVLAAFGAVGLTVWSIIDGWLKATRGAPA